MKLLSILFLSLFSFVFYGQAPKIVPVSPEAAALAKMVNYPINYNTGVPNINIPFYEISVGSLKLPITLNYHAGGFKINEKATRVGLGWSLSCDLQITRSISGKDDLAAQGGYIFNELMRADSDYPFYSTTTSQPYDNTYDLVTGTKDGSPDKFNYKLLNKSGSFYFRKDSYGTGYTIVPVPYDNIKINYNNGVFEVIDTDGTLYYFGAQGNAYQDMSNIVDLKREYTNGSITAWKCDRIVSNNNIDIMTFNYNKKSQDINVSYTDKVEYFYNPQPCFTSGAVYGSNEYPLNGYTDYDQVMQSEVVPWYRIASPKYFKYFSNKTELHLPYWGSQGLVDKMYVENYGGKSKSLSTLDNLSLAEISYRGGKVIFNGINQLNSMKIYDDKNVEIKSIEFSQSLVTTNYNPSINLGSKQTAGTRYLDSLQIRNGSSTFEKYAFLYHSKYDYGNHLTGHDAWGYPNHKTRVNDYYSNNSISLPKTSVVQNIYNPAYDNNCIVEANNVEIAIGGDDNWAESPNQNYIKQGVLKQIVYPTGGRVDYDFEPNIYMDTFHSTLLIPYTQNLPQIGGGLRIRSINYLDENSNFINQKYYKYGELEEGTGLVLTKPKLTSNPNTYNFDVQSYESKNIYFAAAEGFMNSSDYPSQLSKIATEIKTTYEPISSLNYTYPNGSPIYYTKVTEYQQDYGVQTGKTVYSYYNPDEFYVPGNITLDAGNLIEGTNIPYLKEDWFIGAQKTVENYKFDSKKGFTIANKKVFEYSPYNLPPVKVAVVYPTETYQIVSGNYTVTQRVLFNYYADINHIKLSYELPMGKLLLTKEIDTNYEDDKTNSKTTSYTYDDKPFLNPSKITTTNSFGDIIETEHKYAYDFAGNNVYDQMKSENMVSQLIEEIQTNTTQNKVIFRKKTNYEKITEGSEFFAPKTIQSSVKGKDLETDLTFSKYDQYGNLLEFRNKGNIPTSFLWGYNGLNPVAKLENVAYDDIPATYKSNTNIVNPSDEASISTVLNDLRNAFNNYGNKLLSTFTFKRQIGVSSITAPNGNTTYFEYDPIGRLISKKDTNKNILQSFKYNLKEQKLNTSMLYYNIPIMLSKGFNCELGKFNNYYLNGGSVSSFLDFTVNNTAESNLNNGVSYNPILNSQCELASIETTYAYFYTGSEINYPTAMKLDFIQNGSIVATQKIVPNNAVSTTYDSTYLTLPEGEYQLSFRMNADVKYDNGYILDFVVETVGLNTIQHITANGTSFLFEKNKSYKIKVHSIRSTN